MSTDIEKEVVAVLSEDIGDIPFESLQTEQQSPLNQAVIDKEDVPPSVQNWNPWKPEENDPKDTREHPSEEAAPPDPFGQYHDIPDQSPPDAPSQQIDPQKQTEDPDAKDQKTPDAPPEFELPTATAKQAADTILGMANNALAVGGGYFIKIKKHKDFYDFKEVVELIDQQNQKNVKRIQLDKEDKTLLKPLIVLLLKKKAKQLTPEQQLTGAILSILLKKTQVVMEVRAENEILVDRMLDILREEKRESTQESEQQQPDTVQAYQKDSDSEEESPIEDPQQQQPISERSDDVELHDPQQSLLYESVVEIAEDPQNS